MAEAALSMSLDDLIKKNKRSGGGNSRGRGRGSGSGPARRIPNRSVNRSAPYATAKAPDSAWNHDMFATDQPMAFDGHIVGGGRASSIETGTKLYVSNLEYGVSNEDIKELFSEVGDLKRYGIHYDRSGRSKGTAEVVYSRRQDALAAVKRYNNVQLDGKPMKIEIVGTNIVTAPTPSTVGSVGNFNGIPRSGQGRGGGFGRLRGGRGRGRGFQAGRGRGRDRGEKVSAEDLDADLEKYHAEAMETN
nr:THO complex subunit 4A-like [Ipomoea trifida]GMD61348.1 THO complex subunit 4A [Ipomoea batatas]GMD69387.1 THO complex subunit 4A [Ipomoea batatas]